MEKTDGKGEQDNDNLWFGFNETITEGQEPGLFVWSECNDPTSWDIERRKEPRSTEPNFIVLINNANVPFG